MATQIDYYEVPGLTNLIENMSAYGLFLGAFIFMGIALTVTSLWLLITFVNWLLRGRKPAHTGLKVYTDSGTGMEYLSAGTGLIPRLDEYGNHVRSTASDTGANGGVQATAQEPTAAKRAGREEDGNGYRPPYEV